ncbi:multidrug effflux MFS transporter [Elioraea rosea]|uniref:multidrug effflux MFS transporter n=1 Tax=Elioraea rosea TaxID=2492390 RepID=UPI0011826AB7|nr:multidrug effflux MFS transporter [Elioraea rosea]
MRNADASSRPSVPPVWLLAALISLGPLSTDLYLPALPAIADAFGTDAAGVQWTLSGFLLAFAPSQLVYGPMADRFGRRPAMLWGLGLFLAGTAACAVAPTLGLLVLARLVQAIGACAGPVVARAVVRDTVPPERAPAVFATMAGLMSLAPAIGPVLGGAVTALSGWRATFVLLGLVSILVSVAATRRLAETAPALDRAALDPASLRRAYGGLVADRWFLRHALVATASYTGLFCFISGSSHVIQRGLGIGPGAYGLVFASAVGGYLAGSLLVRRLAGRISPRRMMQVGSAWCLVCGWAGPLSLAFAGPSLATVALPLILYMVGFAVVQPNAQAGAIAPFPAMAGRASALLGCLQWSLAALAGLALGSVLDEQGWAMALGIALSGSAAFALVLSLPEEPSRSG